MGLRDLFLRTAGRGSGARSSRRRSGPHGYGGSGRLIRQETNFHQRAAAETLDLIDALGLERPVVWGHSDGAVIALLMGLSAPDRIGGLIVEAAHFFRSKPASRAFFETMLRDPDGLGERVSGVLAREHGELWREVIRTNGDAWLRIASDPTAPSRDVYGGRLAGLRVPTLVIHGARDPRTEPGELDALREALTSTTEAVRHIVVLPEGGHSPHSERATADDVTALAQRFVRDLGRSLQHPSALPDSSVSPGPPDSPVAQGFSPAKS